MYAEARNRRIENRSETEIVCNNRRSHLDLYYFIFFFYYRNNLITSIIISLILYTLLAKQFYVIHMLNDTSCGGR